MISADKVEDNVEHCQCETVGICTLSGRTQKEQSNRKGGGGAHIDLLVGKMIVLDILF